ncbi:hypothetical protein U1769_09395 [Sphingomonas sp. ZT3P38]|uniref:hypothetical protein n=1 Tax=Parasphingomonas zepuensis TaxID=3096161 RepID=UPI002FC5D2D4
MSECQLPQLSFTWKGAPAERAAGFDRRAADLLLAKGGDLNKVTNASHLRIRRWIANPSPHVLFHMTYAAERAGAMNEPNERRQPDEPDALTDRQDVPPAPEREPAGDAVINDAEELDPDQVNPLAPPTNTEAGA